MTGVRLDTDTGDDSGTSAQWRAVLDGAPHVAGLRSHAHVFAPKAGVFALLDASLGGKRSDIMLSAARDIIEARVAKMPLDLFVRRAFNVQRALRAYAAATLRAVHDAGLEQSFALGTRYAPVSVALALVDPRGNSAVLASTGIARSFAINAGGYLCERGVSRRSFPLGPPDAMTHAARLARRYGTTAPLTSGPVSVPLSAHIGFALTSTTIIRPLGTRVERDPASAARQLVQLSTEPSSAVVVVGTANRADNEWSHV
ncbi:MAG: hypothetical protein ACI9MR_001674 [Myxococcota bacterium]